MSEDDYIPPPRVGMPNLTVVMDAGSNERLLEIEGCLVLPLGARIELGSADAAQHGRPTDGEVVGVRVWGASGNPTVVLDVMRRPPGELTGT